MINASVGKTPSTSRLFSIRKVYQNDSCQRMLAFLQAEGGNIHASTTFLMLTVAVSIPMGLFCLALYRSLCAAGQLANLLIGLF